MDYILYAIVAFMMGMVVSLGIVTWFNDKHVDRMKKLDDYRMLAQYNLGRAKNDLQYFDQLIEELGAEGQTLIKYTQVSYWKETIASLNKRLADLEAELIKRIADSRKVAAVTEDYLSLNDAANTIYLAIIVQNGKIREQTQAKVAETPRTMTDGEKAFLSSGLRD